MVIAKHGRGQVARGTRAWRRPLSSFSSSMPLASLKKMLPSGLLAHVRRCAQGLAAEHAVAHLLRGKRQTSRGERPARRRGEPVGPPARRPPQTQLVPRKARKAQIASRKPTQESRLLSPKTPLRYSGGQEKRGVFGGYPECLLCICVYCA